MVKNIRRSTVLLLTYQRSISAERDLARGVYIKSETKIKIDCYRNCVIVKFARTKLTTTRPGDPTFNTILWLVWYDFDTVIEDGRFLNTLTTSVTLQKPNLTQFLGLTNCHTASVKRTKEEPQTLFYPIRRCKNTCQRFSYGEMSCISHVVYLHLTQENEEQRHNIQYFGASVNVLKALLLA